MGTKGGPRVAALYRIWATGFVYPDLGYRIWGYRIWPTAPGKPDMPPGPADRPGGTGHTTVRGSEL